MPTIDEFRKIELVIAQIKEVKEHPNADRLYVLQVDDGKAVRQIVAGIRNAYTPEQLVGRRVVLVSNLDPAVIRGEASNGMLLAASDANGMALLGPDKDMALGSIVK
jgi:methionine--tRNA ligase beta chain